MTTSAGIWAATAESSNLAIEGLRGILLSRPSRTKWPSLGSRVTIRSIDVVMCRVVGWQNTGCAGWTVRDLIFHLLADAQRALVALHTPASGVADVDAVSYWSAWQPGTAGAEANRRGTRIMASAYSTVGSITASYSETALAVLVAGRKRSGRELVATQGHVLTVDSLFSSLAVEATIHQLDLGLGEPSKAGLAHTRMVLDGLLGRNLPIEDAVRYARIGTGRAVPTGQEHPLLGADASRIPLFG